MIKHHVSVMIKRHHIIAIKKTSCVSYDKTSSHVKHRNTIDRNSMERQYYNECKIHKTSSI